jgi:hypothetical protein
MNIPHVNYGKDVEGCVFISVEDTELFDYVEDHLIEKCNLKYEHLTSSENNGVTVYRMCFSKNFEVKDIEKALSKISALELEKIYKINNPS